MDPNSKANRTILKDLEHGAVIGASGRARLPTEGENTKLAYQYGDCRQEVLQELLLQGAIKGPLDRDKILSKNIKVQSMSAKLKPMGKVLSIVDCSGPRTEFEGTAGFIYNLDFPGSLNSTIQKSEFQVNLTAG